MSEVTYRAHGRFPFLWLSPRPDRQAYACGSVWEAYADTDTEPRPRASVWLELGAWNVRGFDATGARFWETFATMTEAESAFRRILRERIGRPIAEARRLEAEPAEAD